MTLNEYLKQETAFTQALKDDYKKLAESDGVEPDGPHEQSFNEWHNDMSLAVTMGIVKDDPNG